MTKIRSLFISDLHIGSSFFQSGPLLSLINTYEPDYLYLVGDFIDGWKFRRGFYWDENCSSIMRRIMDLVENNGTKVRYAIGNHDEFWRVLGPSMLGSIEVAEEFSHKTLKGHRLRVIHGDYLDTTVKNIAWLAHFGDYALSIALTLGKLHKWIESKLGFKYWSFSNYIKRSVQKALRKMNDFENLIIQDAIRLGYNGVICGHIHKPDCNIGYYNCGDWVENGTALIENYQGELKIIESDTFDKLNIRFSELRGYDWPG